MDFLTKVLAAMLARLLADDLKARLPPLNDFLIKVTVRRLADELQERWSREWELNPRPADCLSEC
jgi:hypothetical protein